MTSIHPTNICQAYATGDTLDGHYKRVRKTVLLHQSQGSIFTIAANLGGWGFYVHYVDEETKFWELEKLAQGHTSTLLWKWWHFALCHLGCCMELIIEPSLEGRAGQWNWAQPEMEYGTGVESHAGSFGLKLITITSWPVSKPWALPFLLPCLPKGSVFAARLSCFVNFLFCGQFIKLTMNQTSRIFQFWFDFAFCHIDPSQDSLRLQSNLIFPFKSTIFGVLVCLFLELLQEQWFYEVIAEAFFHPRDTNVC